MGWMFWGMILHAWVVEVNRGVAEARLFVESVTIVVNIPFFLHPVCVYREKKIKSIF